MKTIEQLAIECGAEIGTWDKSGNGQKLIAFTHGELTAFAEAYHAQKEAQKFKLKGTIIEIGSLEDEAGRGIRLESNGEFIAVIGMTEDECRETVKWFTQEVEITIATPLNEGEVCQILNN